MNGTFVGYNNSSKAYGIYIKEGHRIEVSRDVIFDESIAFKKSKDLPIDFDDEEPPMFEEDCTREEEDSNHEEIGPSEPVQQFSIPQNRKRTNWLNSTLLDIEGHGVAKGTFRESKTPKRYSDLQPI